MDFFTTIVIVIALQDSVGHVAPLTLQFGVSHQLKFVVILLACPRVANYFDDRKYSRVLAGHVTFHSGTIGVEELTLA